MPGNAKDPKRNKRLFVTDLHMGAGRTPKLDKHDYDWLKPAEAESFANFLKYVNESDDVKEVVLLGDVMETWVCPVDEVPPSFDEIISAKKNKDIVKQLKNLAKNEDIKLLYFPGNHDMSITADFLEFNFPGIVFGGSAAHNSAFSAGRILAEHGSAYAMFCAPDPVNNPGNRLPLGYFISRIVATKVANTGSAKHHYWRYVDDLIECLGPQTLPASVFEAVLEEADLPEDVEIKMSSNGGRTYSVGAGEVKEKYKNVYEDWRSKKGDGMAFLAVWAELGHLGKIADLLCKKGNTKIVIFGHSHGCKLDKDSWLVEDRIYANCGTWCDEDKPRTFVETEKDTKAGRHYVRLMEWDGREAHQMGQEYLEI